MIRLIRAGAVVAIMAAALLLNQTPASAHPGAAAFAGTAFTTGTWLPTAPACIDTSTLNVICPSANNWNFSSDIANVGVEGTTVYTNLDGLGLISGAGAFNGWCGASTGSGNFNTPQHSGTIGWVSAGGTIVLVGEVGGTSAVAATVQARPISTAGSAACVDHAATQFLVVGAAAVAHV